jgi:hypothetical protein
VYFFGLSIEGVLTGVKGESYIRLFKTASDGANYYFIKHKPLDLPCYFFYRGEASYLAVEFKKFTTVFSMNIETQNEDEILVLKEIDDEKYSAAERMDFFCLTNGRIKLVNMRKSYDDKNAKLLTTYPDEDEVRKEDKEESQSLLRRFFFYGILIITVAGSYLLYSFVLL